MNIANSMVLRFGALENLWEETILFACYILNRVVVKENMKTTHESWESRVPRLDILK